MTEDEQSVLRRAAEAGYFEDLTGRWMSVDDGEVAPPRNSEDTVILHELHERASTLLGRALATDEGEVAPLLGTTFYVVALAPGERLDEELSVFAWKRFHDQPWRLG